MTKYFSGAFRIMCSLLFVAVVLPRSRPEPQQDLYSHPILLEVVNKGLVIPRDKWDFPARVTVLGTSCTASVLLYATILTREPGRAFVLEYERTATIDIGKPNPDACDELEVPEIHTKFNLTFMSPKKNEEIAFTGYVQPSCNDCSPKKGRVISGVIKSRGHKKYWISFTGDLSDRFDLEPLGD